MREDVIGQFGCVGVLMGGVSSERDISLKSGRAIVESLARQGVNVVPIDITGDDADVILSQCRHAGIDTAFIALHGGLGEDGTIQAILEKADIPYTGSGVEASRLAINKVRTQDLLKKRHLSVPPYVAVTQGSVSGLKATIDSINGFPVVVKPACEGSSIGITLVQNEAELNKALELAWQFDRTVLIEQYIKGRELTVGIIGSSALPVIEIRPKGRFFDYDAKYTKGLTRYIVPALLTDAITRELKDAALKAHREIGCKDLSRVDFMLDRKGRYYILEVNTVPGFTSTSLVPKAAAQAGISFDELCAQLLVRAYGKKKEIKKSTTTLR